MKLSIITINLNNRVGLQKTIESVIGQTFDDFEWIVIDGGSTDGSAELIAQYADHFAYWVSEPDKGIYNAMNKRIRQAEGEWLQFLNGGDMLYEESTLQKIFEKDYYADVFYGNAKNINKNGSIGNYIAPDILSYSYLYSGRSISHQASFFRRTLFDDNLYDEHFQIVSDRKYYLDLILKGCSFEHIDQFVVWYDNSGISTVLTDVWWQERKDVRDSCPPHLKPDMDWISHFRQVYYNGKFCTALTNFFLLIVAGVSRCRNHIITWRIKIKNKYHR